MLGVEAGGAVGQLASRLHHDVVVERAETLKLAVPALCYTVQNNLVFVAISNLSAAAAQVLYQTKTLSTALFSVLILKKSFPRRQWLSFVMLAAGVVLVQSQDAKSHVARTGGSPLVGGLAALGAAGLSGFAGVYLELVFTKAGSSLFMRNIQLALFSIPLQAVAILQTDREAVLANGMMQGFDASTWAVVFIQFAGAMLTAVVIKYAGNILKTFATVRESPAWTATAARVHTTPTASQLGCCASRVRLRCLRFSARASCRCLCFTSIPRLCFGWEWLR